MQEDGFDTWTAENLDRKDLLVMWKSITHALISTGHVVELHQELDHASRTGREDLSSGGQWAVESCCDPALLLNESLQTATNSTVQRMTDRRAATMTKSPLIEIR